MNWTSLTVAALAVLALAAGMEVETAFANLPPCCVAKDCKGPCVLINQIFHIYDDCEQIYSKATPDNSGAGIAANQGENSGQCGMMYAGSTAGVCYIPTYSACGGYQYENGACGF